MENNISNMLDQFKDILDSNSNNTSTFSSDINKNKNLNITPEMITNLANTLKNSQFKDTISKTLNVENNSPNQSISNQDTEINSSLDIDTILKIKSIIESLNKKDDTRANLLYSLKPYLRESRQKKVDQYVNLFKISGITKLLKKEKGEFN